MCAIKTKLSLDQPGNYQIKVPGNLEDQSFDEVSISVVTGEDGFSISTLTGTFDQAGLHGLLRRLYSFGLPLISVQWIDQDE